MKPTTNTQKQAQKKVESRVKETDRQKRVTTLLEHIELAVEEIMEGYQDLGITVESDFRGYTTNFTVRIHKDKAGGILKRNTYHRKKGSA